MPRIVSKPVWLVLAAASLVACGTGSDPTPDGGADAATPVDAGAVPDAGQAVDAGDAPDAGEVPDAGDEPDAGSRPTGTITGRVVEALSGGTVALAGAVVSGGGVTVTTGADGTFTLEPVPLDAPVGVSVAGPSDASSAYSGSFREVPVAAGAASFVSFELLRGCRGTVDLSGADATFRAAGCGYAGVPVSVTLPAGGVVGEDGSPVTSVDVRVAALPMQLLGRPTGASLVAFPGDLSAVRTDGGDAFLESRGALEVRLSDAATGAPVAIAGGRTATVRFPAMAESLDDAAVPAWWFDEAANRWREEGATTVTTDPSTGALVHELVVSHFTWWNADVVATRTCLGGRLVDTAGAPVTRAQVGALGVDYRGYHARETDAGGRFEVFARASSDVELRAERLVGTTVARASRTLRSPAAASACFDLGDVVLDLAAATSCVRGRVVDLGGQGVAGLDVIAWHYPDVYTTRTGTDGAFCLPAPTGVELLVEVGGTAGGSSVAGRTRHRVQSAATAACGGGACDDVGTLTAVPVGCVKGRVLSTAGAVPGAFVQAWTTSLGWGRADANGAYCVPVETSGALQVLALDVVGASSRRGTARHPGLSSGGSCGQPETCLELDVGLGDPSCVRGVARDASGGPLANLRVLSSATAGGPVSRTTTAADGSFCALARAGEQTQVELTGEGPGVRYHALVQATPAATPAACSVGGCATLGDVTVTATAFAGCIRGRLTTGGAPYRDAVEVRDGDRIAILRRREDDSFCVDVRAADQVTFLPTVDPDACPGSREDPVVPTTGVPNGSSCAAPDTCLDVGAVDFADFCSGS